MSDVTRLRLDLDSAGFQLRELGFRDAIELAGFVRDPRFSFPLLTGAGGPLKQRRPFVRAASYVFYCIIANRFGSLLFGKRRHWIMALTDNRDSLRGVIMVDGLLRELPRPDAPVRGQRWLKRAERRVPLRQGDGEIGFFLHPEVWGRGLAFQGVVALCAALSNEHEANGAPLLRRIWAETGEDNHPARMLLGRLGLVERPEFRLVDSDRYRRDGSQITLLHFAQPAADEALNPECPVHSRLDQLAR